jgi:hypothetical protein
MVVKMFKEYNANPYGKHVGDCTVRAISKIIGKNWHETYLDLCLMGLIMGDMPSSNAVTTAFLKKQGFKRRTIPDSCPDEYTIADFCADHPLGSYIIGTGTHLTAVIDGDLWDNWNSSNEYPVYFFERK